MLRRVLALATMAALVPTLTAPAADPPVDAVRQEAALRQELLARRFRELEHALLRLAQRLEASPKPEDRDKAAAIRKALEVANKESVDVQFDKLIATLRKSGSVTPEDVRTALAQNEVVIQDLRAILAVFGDDRDAQLKAERERLARLIKQLDEAIRAEKVLRARLDGGERDPKDLAAEQRKITEATEKIAEEVRKQFGPDAPAARHVQDGVGKQKKGEEDIAGNRPGDADDDIDGAIDDLEHARDLFRRLARQDREEEIERRLASLRTRCERMLELQTEVYEATVPLHRDIAGQPGQAATRTQQQKAIQLGDREGEVHKDADAAVRLLEEDGTVVAFLEVFRQVRDDVGHVERRLARADVGTVTQSIETDVIDTLKEMIAALKKAQRPPEPPSDGRHGEPPPDPGPRPERPLVDQLAQLKMIRSMQLRVNRRTQVYGEQYPGEQAADPEVRKELKNLAERQSQVGKSAADLDRVSRGTP
jgi:hypothetical protein